MRKNLLKKIIIYSIIIINTSDSNVNIVGNAYFNDGLGRLPISLIHTLKNDLEINFISTRDRSPDLTGVPEDIRQIITKKNTNLASISILFDAPWFIGGSPYTKIPNNTIKFAYSMLESSAIPKKWVNIFNNNFDGIIVPDKFLITVYRNSGVKIPIFVLPCILLLEDFLNVPLKKTQNKCFRFGVSAAYGIEKGHDILIEAFAKEFNNNPNFELIVHGRWGNPEVINYLKTKIKKLNSNNITFIEKIFTQNEYIEFLKSLDCYVLLSRGEGFSITPREAMALGIPCILTNHTAHKTICETGLVVPVKAEIKKPIFYSSFKSHCGHQLTCTIADARKALKEVYLNYDKYLQKASLSREWVKQYLPDYQRKKYINLIKPKQILLGKHNLITNDYLMTNSLDLFKKYKKIKTS